MLVWLKTLPRKDAKAASRGAKPGRSVPAPGGGKVLEAAQKKEQAQQDWLGLSSKLTADWCKSLCTLGQAKSRAAAESGQPASDGSSRLPPDLALGNGARVVAEYHIIWPANAPPALKRQNPGLLEIYYVRAEETNKLKKAAGFYARQAKAAVSETQMIDKALWLDSSRTDAKTGRRRSIDVLIGRGDATAGTTTKDDNEADLTIEILVVEIKNPM
jgi:hypothetical protein